MRRGQAEPEVPSVQAIVRVVGQRQRDPRADIREPRRPQHPFQQPRQRGQRECQPKTFRQRAVLFPMSCAGPHAHGDGEKQRVQQHELRAPKFSPREPACWKRDGHRGKDCQQHVEGAQRRSGELAEDDVETAKVREEQQAERAVAFFLAETVGGLPHSFHEAQQENQRAECVEQLLARLPRSRAPAAQLRPAQSAHRDQTHEQRDNDARPDCPRLARAGAQFTFDDGQGEHAVASRRVCGAIPWRRNSDSFREPCKRHGGQMWMM